MIATEPTSNTRLIIYTATNGHHWLFEFRKHLELCRIVGTYARDRLAGFTWHDAANVVHLGRALRGDGND